MMNTNQTYDSLPKSHIPLASPKEKQVVEEVSGWLRVYDDASVDRTWTGPPEVKFMSDPVPPHLNFVDGVATKDVTVDENSGRRVRIYLPEKDGKLPIILHFHGGGFCISQADWYMYYAVYTRLACVANAMVVSVFLPLAPENPLPAACETGYSAFLWLRALSRGAAHEPWLSDRGNFDKVFLIGDSSGANVAHHVAVRAGNDDIAPLRLAGAIPIHPGFCRASRSKSELEQPETPFLTLAMLDKFLAFALPPGSTKDHPITCPMGGAATPIADLKLPPYLYCVAENDLLKDTEMEFYQAMKDCNKDIELMINSGVSHSFYLNKIAVDLDPVTGSETERLLAEVAKFVEKY